MSCRSDLKTEQDAETHSRDGARQRSRPRSSTPELRLTRSMQQPPGGHPHPPDPCKAGRSLPVKLEQHGPNGEPGAPHQGSSGSPGKGTGSSSQLGGPAAKRRGSKAGAKDGDVVKAEVTSSRLRQSTAGGSTSGESQSHIDLAAACQDQGDALGGSGEKPLPSAYPVVVYAVLGCCACSCEESHQEHWSTANPSHTAGSCSAGCTTSVT